MRIYELFEDLPSLPGLMNVPKMATIKPTGTTTANSTQANVTPNINSIPPNVQQQFARGSTVTVPEGPGNVKTQLKINAVDTTNKTVTVGNPHKPNEPSLTYKQTDFANLMAH
jgi:hypothetical protein